MSEFGLQLHIDDLYERTQHQFEFVADHLNAAKMWQEDFRKSLADILKITDRKLIENPIAEKIATVDRVTYVEEKHVLHVDDCNVPMYLLVPKTPPPHRAVVAFHGHGKLGIQLILGNYGDSEMAESYRSNDENFAQRLAEDGYLVCAIEQRGFGERVTDQITRKENGNSCRHLAFSYLLHNRTLAGERVWDGMAAVSYVLNRDDIVPNDLSCVGFSGGGTTTLFLSALDDRLTRTVIQGYFCTMKKSILGMEHCECNYVPNLLKLGEIADIAGLIAPRELCIIAGESDPIFPIEGVHEQYKRLEDIYRVFESDENCSLRLHQEGHRPNYGLMESWLKNE